MINGQKGQSKRFLPMNQTLFELFTEIKDNDPKTPFNFNPDYITKKIAKYYKSAKIKGANTHSLRKTFGSLLIQNNVADIYTVSKLLGHASVNNLISYITLTVKRKLLNQGLFFMLKTTFLKQKL